MLNSLPHTDAMPLIESLFTLIPAATWSTRTNIPNQILHLSRHQASALTSTRLGGILLEAETPNLDYQGWSSDLQSLLRGKSPFRIVESVVVTLLQLPAQHVDAQAIGLIMDSVSSRTSRADASSSNISIVIPPSTTPELLSCYGMPIKGPIYTPCKTSSLLVSLSRKRKRQR